MPAPAQPPALPESLAAAVQRGDLSAGAGENLARYFAEPQYEPFRPEVERLAAAGDWTELDALFFEVIPFGTGGRRGRMSDFGTATMNPRTVAESADGLARYLASQKPDAAKKRGGLSAVVAHDTRNRSEEFARLTATTLAANGVRTFVFRGHRSTPELSFAVRHLGCDAGVVVSASHNPPGDNGFKAYWDTGGQVLPPHDRGIIDAVYASGDIPGMSYEEAIDDGLIEEVGEQIDTAYVEAVASLSLSGSRDVKAIFTPLHGVGETNVFAVLDAAGFRDVEILDAQRDPDGNFPTVDANFPNPERLEVYEPAIARARETGAEVILATDPDADRLGVVARDGNGDYRHISGNRVGALICDHVLRKRHANDTLPTNGYVVETMVTTPLIGAVAEAAGVRVIDDLLVGFKYIGQVMDREGPDGFLFGAEESLGYLAGQYARDKDAAIAALYVCELAAGLKAEGKTLHDRLDELFAQHGYFAEGQFSEKLPGSGGKALTAKLMTAFRTAPPASLGGVALSKVRDYGEHEVRRLPANERSDALPEPDGNLLMFESAGFAGTGGGKAVKVAVRPSGTEPKIKFYTFASAPVPDGDALPGVKSDVDATLKAVQGDLSRWVAETMAKLAEAG